MRLPYASVGFIMPLVMYCIIVTKNTLKFRWLSFRLWALVWTWGFGGCGGWGCILLLALKLKKGGRCLQFALVGSGSRSGLTMFGFPFRAYVFFNERAWECAISISKQRSLQVASSSEQTTGRRKKNYDIRIKEATCVLCASQAPSSTFFFIIY